MNTPPSVPREAVAAAPRAASRASLPRVLCVDDDERLLAGLELRLRRVFDVVTATSAADALARLDLSVPFAAVVSDMRMPRADGATFLAAIRKVAPETTRILLTGQVDLPSALAAVNDGEVFRILLKPCDTDVMITVLQAAVTKHRHLVAQRAEGEAMLRGTIELVSLALRSSTSALAEWSTQLRALVAEIGAAICPDELWAIDWAVVLLHVSLAEVPIAVAQRWRSREPLSSSDAQQVDAAIHHALDIVSRTPRTDVVRALLASLLTTESSDDTSRTRDEVALPMRVLRLALEFDARRLVGASTPDALESARRDLSPADVALFEALARSPAPMETGSSSGALGRVREGERLMQEVRLPNGMLLFPKGHEVTAATLELLVTMDESVRQMQVITMSPERSVAP